MAEPELPSLPLQDILSIEEVRAIAHAVGEECPPDLPLQHCRRRLRRAIDWVADARLRYGTVCRVLQGGGVFTFDDNDQVTGVDLFEDAEDAEQSLGTAEDGIAHQAGLDRPEEGHLGLAPLPIERGDEGHTIPA